MRTLARAPTTNRQRAPNACAASRRGHFRQSAGVTSILDLQRTIGNQAVQRMLEASSTMSADAATRAFRSRALAAISANATPVVQRQPQAVDIDDLLKEAGETAETAESLKKQLAEGIEDVEIVKWRLALRGQTLPGAESRIDEKTTPFFVEGLIETSAFLAPYLRGKLAKTSIGGDKSKFIIYGSPEELESERDKLDRRVTPMTKAAPRKRTYGFYHRRTDSVHLVQDAQFGHALHEGVHKYSSKAMEDRPW